MIWSGELGRASHRLDVIVAGTLLGDNYQHALELLLTAEIKYLSDRSGWLASQNSFNDAAFRAFQAFLESRSLSGAMNMLDQKGKLHPFGRLLDKDTVDIHA